MLHGEEPLAKLSPPSGERVGTPLSFQ